MVSRFARLVALSGATMFVSACGGELVRIEEPNTVRFYFPPTELKSHILAAALFLFLAMLLPYIVRAPSRLRKTIYLLALALLLVATATNIYLYFAKRAFQLELARDGVVVNDIRGTTRLAWDEIFEVVQTTRLGLELPDWVPLARENYCMKFKGGKERKTAVVIPDAFSVEDRTYFFNLLLARQVIISKEERMSP